MYILYVYMYIYRYMYTYRERVVSRVRHPEVI